MNWTLFLPGLVLGILLFIMLNKRFKVVKLPRINLKKLRVNVEKRDDLIRNLGLIGFFCMFYVAIRGYDWRIAGIICGLMGLWFFFPRGEGR